MNYVECPVEGNILDQNTTRLVASMVVLLAFTSLWLYPIWIFAFLMVDFGLRAFAIRKYSPLRWLAKRIQFQLQIPSKPIDAGPKTFAAKIGLLFSLTIFICLTAHLFIWANALILILTLCAFLESVFSICLACLVYPWTKKISNLI